MQNPTSSPWRRRLILLLFITAAFLLGATAQEQLGISFTAEGLASFREWVQNFGWWGPAVFILLVIVRLFIGLSSHLVFTLGGLAFGVTGGIVWGSIGLVASALVLFYLARVFGTQWVQARFGEQYVLMVERINRLGGIAVFAITAHPIGLLTPAHLASGLVGLGPGVYTLAVAVASPIRTAPYAVLGTAVLDLTLVQSLAIAAGLLLVFVLPLFSKRVRAWLWGDQR